MTTVILTKWGNSIGIRIPAALIKEAHMYPGEELEIKADGKGGLTLIPLKSTHDEWLEQFNAVADSDNESTHFDVANDFDGDEWTW